MLRISDPTLRCACSAHPLVQEQRASDPVHRPVTGDATCMLVDDSSVRARCMQCCQSECAHMHAALCIWLCRAPSWTRSLTRAGARPSSASSAALKLCTMWVDPGAEERVWQSQHLHIARLTIHVDCVKCVRMRALVKFSAWCHDTQACAKALKAAGASLALPAACLTNDMAEAH